MATLWDVVVGNSALSPGPGVTFWDHINNPKTGSGTDRTYITPFSSAVTNCISSKVEIAVRSSIRENTVASRVTNITNSKVRK